MLFGSSGYGPLTIRVRRGLEKDRLDFIPKESEPLWTTDEHKLYLGDGVTPGGNYLCDLPGGFFKVYPVPPKEEESVVSRIRSWINRRRNS
jgi:hypothetical protein